MVYFLQSCIWPVTRHVSKSTQNHTQLLATWVQAFETIFSLITHPCWSDYSGFLWQCGFFVVLPARRWTSTDIDDEGFSSRTQWKWTVQQRFTLRRYAHIRSTRWTDFCTLTPHVAYKIIQNFRWWWLCKSCDAVLASTTKYECNSSRWLQIITISWVALGGYYRSMHFCAKAHICRPSSVCLSLASVICCQQTCCSETSRLASQLRSSVPKGHWRTPSGVVKIRQSEQEQANSNS